MARGQDCHYHDRLEIPIAGIEFLRAFPVDLLFIDVNMPDLTGIELVRSLNDKPMIIFTTAYKKFAIDGFELDAVDYLLKPIDFERFSKVVSKAISFYEYKNSIKNETYYIYSSRIGYNYTNKSTNCK